jgi:hypothetical protein
MRTGFLRLTVLAVAIFSGVPAYGGRFNAPGDCAVGKRVVTSDQHQGKITRVATGATATYCRTIRARR